MKRYSIGAIFALSLFYCSILLAQTVPVSTSTPTANTPSGEDSIKKDSAPPKGFSPTSPSHRSKNAVPISESAQTSQSTMSDTASKDIASSEKELDPSSKDEIKEKPEAKSISVAGAAMAMATGGGTSTAQIPKLNSLSVQVEPFTGSASVPIPISVPPGRAGIQPSIALVYNSGSPESFTGVGWNLDLGSIQRSTKKGPPKYNSTDTFVLMQNGSSSNLVFDSSSGINYYRQEIEGAFAKIESSGSGSAMTWIMTDKKGTRYFFGQTAASQQADPADTAKIFKWALSRVQDINGNYMTISYIKHGNELYPDTIRYTGNSTTSPVINTYAKVVFVYKDTNPLRTLQSYRSSFLVSSSKLLDKINIYTNDLFTGNYRFAYQQSGNSKRYLLSTVKQYGADGTSSLPTVTFSYQGAEKGFTDPPDYDWAVPSNASFVYHETSGKWTDRGMRVADVNGDAYPDLLRGVRACGDTYSIAETYLNTKTEGFQLTTGSAWNVPEPAKGFLRSCNEADYSWGLQLADIDGDMWVDLIRNYKRDPSLGGTFYRQTFLNDEVGSFGSEVAAWAPPTNTAVIWQKGVGPGTEYSEYQGVVYADVNGDSFTDIVISKNSGTANHNVYINQAAAGGTGWVLDPVWTTPVSVDSDFAQSAALVDLNGDGLPDIIDLDGDTTATVYMNNGHGWTQTSTPWDTLPYNVQLNTGDYQFADINGDGLTDLVKGNYWLEVLINTGSGWFDDIAAWQAPSGYFARQDQRLLDANADGMMDYMYHIAGSVAEVYVNEGKPADLLVKIENGIGGKTDITYDSSAHYTNTFLPFIVQVVKSIKVSTATESYSKNYEYSGGLWSVQGREFRGFATVKVIDPDGNYTTTNYLQDQFTKGMVLAQASYNAAGNLFNKAVNTWAIKTIMTGNVCVFPYLKKVDQYVYDGDASGKRSAQEFFYDESLQYGNLTKTVQYGEVDLATGSDSPSNDKRTTETTYLNSTAPYILGLPKQITIKDHLNNQLRQTSFYYDNHSNLTDSPSKGLLTKRVRWGGAGLPNPTDLYTYDATGNLLTTTDPMNNVTTIAYDPIKLFPLTTTNALGQVVTTEYYGINTVALNDGAGLVGLWGQVKSVKDSNNQKAYRVYDTFGRMTKSISPLDSVSFPTTIIEYTYTSQHTSIKTRQRRNHGVAGVVDAVQFYDGLGRLVQTKTKAIAANQYVVSDQTQYNSRGLPEKKYVSRFTSNNFTVMDPIVPTEPKVRIEYDAMGRVLKTINPDGSYSNTIYDDWNVVQRDERGAQKEFAHDAYGRVYRVREYTGYDGRSSLYPAANYAVHAATMYAYDKEGNLTMVTDALGNVTNINYDKLGRKISMDDPDMGVWSYTYDLNGNLLSQTDAKNQIITFTYDALNRLKSKTSGATINVNYTYDDTVNSGYSKGRLSKVDYTGGSARFVYDAMGRETQSVKNIDGINYKVSRVYDAMNNVTKITYPDLSEVFYQYNTVGQLQAVSNSASVLPPLVSNHQPSSIDHLPTTITMFAKKMRDAWCNLYASWVEPNILGVKEAEAAAPSTLFVSNIVYNANGQALSVAYGNGITTTNEYFPLTFRLKRIYTVKSPSTILQDLNYTYDPVGNITAINDAKNTADQSFTYDVFSRLKTAVNSNAAPNGYGSLNYSYNAIGNITAKEGVTFTYSGVNAGPHAVSSLNDGTSLAYDTNGNMTTMNKTGDNKTFTYDMENRLIEVKKNSLSVGQYVYDGDGGRVKKSVINGGSATTTKYIGSLEEITGASITNHIYLGSQQIASITNSAVVYIHSDHLGSANVTTDASGALKELTEYKPFGGFSRHEKYGSSQETAWFYFTGKKLDDESGLYYYGARYYSALLGKFITADSVVQAAMNPQTLNRYSYCNNNPINVIDPTGHWSFKKFFTSLVGAVVGVTLGIVSGGALTPVIGAFWAGIAGGSLGGAVGGGLTAALQGGGWSQIGMSALMGAGFGAVGGGIGSSSLGTLTKSIIGGVALAGGAAYAVATDNLDNFAGALVGGFGGYATGTRITTGKWPWAPAEQAQIKSGVQETVGNSKNTPNKSLDANLGKQAVNKQAVNIIKRDVPGFPESRPVVAQDLGIDPANITTLKGSLSMDGDEMLVRIHMLRASSTGVLTGNVRGVVPSLLNVAARNGATSIKVEAIYANEGLYYYVQKNYGPLNNEGSGVDSFTMQIPRGDQ